MKEIKRYNLDPTITRGDCEVKLNLTEDNNYGYYVKYTDHKEVVENKDEELRDKTGQIYYLNGDIVNLKGKVETMQKRIGELEAERKQIKSTIDPGYDDIRYSMMLLNEILKEVY